MPPVNAMLLALQAATEAYLDKPINTTDIALPTSILNSKSSLMDLEIGRLGLRRTSQGYPTALKAAMWAQRMTWDHSELSESDDPRLILAIDYSQSALTAALFSNDAGVLEEHRFEQGLDIGADASPSHLPWSKELLRKRRGLLEEVTRLPIQDVRFELSDRISELVLIGDCAKDDQLLSLLEGVLGLGVVARVRDVKHHDKVDPVFTAAKAMAAVAKGQIDEGENSCLAWDCTGWWDEWMGL